MTSPPRRVFVTGASGFVGTSMVEELVARNVEVSALVHSSEVAVHNPLITTTTGGLFDAAAMREAMYGCDAVIHLVGIIFENPKKGITFRRIHVDGTKTVLKAAEAVGVERFIHMSALGARPDAVSEYHRTKHEAEQLVQASGRTFTIFRPSMIHGPRGEFMQQAAAWARGKTVPFVAMPYFGRGLLGLGGAGKLQPVYVKDVARAFIDAIDNEKSFGRVYNLAGPDVVTWPQLHGVISEAVRGKRKPTLPLPAWYAKLLARAAPAGWLPFNLAQVQMSQEDNAGDTTEFRADFDVELHPFAPTVWDYADRL